MFVVYLRRKDSGGRRTFTGEGGEGEGGMGAKGTPGRGSCPALHAFCSLQYINTQKILFRAVHTVKHLSVK